MRNAHLTNSHTQSRMLYTRLLRPHFGQPGKKLPAYIRSNITNKNRIRKAWQSSKDPALKDSIKRLTNIIKKQIKIFNSNNWSNFTANLSDNSTSLWRKVAALRSNSTTIPPLTSDAGTTAISPLEKAELIADCWRTQFSPNPNQNHVSTDTLIISAAHHYLHEPQATYINAITASETLNFIHSLKTNKAPENLKTYGFNQQESVSNALVGNRIIGIEILSNVFSELSCPKCFNNNICLFEDSKYGLCSHFTLKCGKCDFLKGFSSTQKTLNVPEVNARCVYGMRQRLFCSL
ncbi:RNA-directed DNA polymerase from mobile element jockey [Caerostris darwini]|uniref:RNA-directed DNA polymerase from mobile element jockey n=1 Tax=Caerostris darwini TaxID=1538125 RepID=A0AAV4QV28_9ARAC|nr:RNA-directed DNA polymerase from mobile element jockey [Caerostris darwini]